MALADIRSNLKPDTTPWRTCATCHALAGLPDSEAAVLLDLLSDPSVRYKELAKLLEADPESPTIEWQALSRHARGECEPMRAAKARLR